MKPEDIAKAHRRRARAKTEVRKAICKAFERATADMIVIMTILGKDVMDLLDEHEKKGGDK